MSKRGRRRAKRQKQQQPVSQSQPRKALWKLTLGALSSSIALLGAVSAALTLLPRVTVSASDPVDQNDPFSTSITVANTGYLRLNHVTYGLAISSIDLTSGPGVSSEDEYGAVLFPDVGKDHDLGIDDKLAFPLSQILDGDSQSLASARLAMLVQYEVPLLHWKRQKLFPLVTQRVNGRFYWYAQPWAKDYSVGRPYRISKPIHLPRLGDQHP